MSNTDIEQRLWSILREHAHDDPTRTVSITELGVQRLPTHKQQLTQLVAKWENMGLVTAFRSNTHARLTEKGLNTEVIE